MVKRISNSGISYTSSLTQEKFVLAMGQGPEETAPPTTSSRLDGKSSSPTHMSRTTPAIMIFLHTQSRMEYRQNGYVVA
jgi:hypothetical protein